MPFLLALSGALFVAVALLDALWTTIVPRGAGPLTKRIARGWWAASLWVHRRRPGGAHGLLALAGPAILVVGFSAWVLLLWAGWTLLFSADPGAVVDAGSKAPAELWARVYYVGFVLFTLGTGDYVPAGASWQVASAAASLSGLFVVTLAITYVISVVSAVAEKRQLAGAIHALGSSAPEIVAQAWDGSGFDGLDQHLPPLGKQLELHHQRHLAYPVLHYFHSTERRAALGPAVAAFDDALLLLSEAVAEDARPAPAVVDPPRRAVSAFLSRLGEAFVEPAGEAPPPPATDALRCAGIPLASEYGAGPGDARRRKLLRGLVEDGGWPWDDASADRARPR